MTLRENNQQAIEKAERTYGKLNNVEPYGNPGEVISYLRVCGLVCVKCGKSKISWPVLRFQQFEPGVVCYDCQHLN